MEKPQCRARVLYQAPECLCSPPFAGDWGVPYVRDRYASSVRNCGYPLLSIPCQVKNDAGEERGTLGFRWLDKPGRDKRASSLDLRHTFASRLVMAGVDLYTVKELLGHKTTQMTSRYVHLSPDHQRRAVEILVPVAPVETSG